jgi:uncharacterized oxidoreductase
MLSINHDNLRAVCRAISSAGGSADEEATQVADNLVTANLTGHDSHGIGMLPRYIACIPTGELKPNAEITVISDEGTTLVLDGNHGYGQVVGKKAMEMGIERAREHGVCVVTVRNSFHLCRIGAWGEQCADAGMVSMHHVNVHGHDGLVAPFGGTDSRFTTNPYCAVLPGTDNNPHTVLDFATSIVAGGKVRVAKNKGEQMPEGYLIDNQGQHTTDPNAMYTSPKGAILPMGGHKGYGLSVINELFGGVLSGGGVCIPENKHDDDTILNGMLSIIIDPMRLVTKAFFNSETDATIAHVKASPPSNPDEPILVPGDPERATRAERSSQGVPVDDETWAEMIGAAECVGLTATEIEAIAFRN